MTTRLTREEEAQLARAWQRDRDERAASRLLGAHQSDVRAMARRYRDYGVPVTDLIAEGHYGLARAIERFDPERGVRFRTYASRWIRAYVLEHVMRSWSVVGGGAGALRTKIFFKLRRERARATALLGESAAADEEVAGRLGTSTEKVLRMECRIRSRDAAMDAPKGESGATMVETMPTNGATPEEQLMKRERRSWASAAVHRAIGELDQREAMIVRERLLRDSEDAPTLKALGSRLGVSRERVRQLEARAKRKLSASLGAAAGAY